MDRRRAAHRNAQDEVTIPRSYLDPDLDPSEKEKEKNEKTSRANEVTSLPSKFKVCPTCEGRGSHTNPSIDEHGLTEEDFDEDPDFRESYFEGVYDVPCYECDGNRVVPTIDTSRCTPQQVQAYQQYLADQYHDSEAEEAERRAGA